MSSSTAMPRFAYQTRLRASAFALLVLPVVTGASVRLRHLGLKRSEPAARTQLTTAPQRISLWFTAKPELPFSRIHLIEAAGSIPLDPVVADTANSLHATISRTLGPGEYRVEWQTASADGHPIRGEFAFTVLPAGSAAPSSSTSVPAGPSTHAGYAAPPEAARRDDSTYRTTRWLEFAAILTILGALGFRHGVLPPLAARGVPTADAADRARRLGMSMLTIYGIAVLVRLYTQSRTIHGADTALDPGALTLVITRTTWGIGWSAGVVGAALLLVGWWLSKRSVTFGTPLALTGALGLVMSPALSGHAAAAKQFVLSVTLDVLHVTAAGVWVGGLAMVLFAGIPAMLRLTEGNKHAAVSALVNSFHPLALFCAPIAVVSGLTASWIRLGSIGALWTTLYGRTLLLKVLFVVLLAAMGAYNSMRVRRQLSAAGGAGSRQFRVTGSLELAFGAVVLIMTTFLVATPPPSELMSP